MIGYLLGQPKLTSSGLLVVCHGVGYSVLVTKGNQAKLALQSECELYIHAHIKEDAFDLYGFLSEGEKQLFLKLIDVDGVGPKTAMNIMDRGTDAIVQAVQSADISFFSSITRVGKKSAQKIIIELKNTLGGTEELDLSEPVGKTKEVIEALTSLGFSETESQKVTKTFDVESMKIEEAVKKAIQALTRKR